MNALYTASVPLYVKSWGSNFSNKKQSQGHHRNPPIPNPLDLAYRDVRMCMFAIQGKLGKICCGIWLYFNASYAGV